MFWALGAIFLQLHPVPQSAVATLKPMMIEENSVQPAAENKQIILTADNSLLVDLSFLNDATPLEPGRPVLTPLAAPAAALPASPSPAPIAPVIAGEKGKKPQFGGEISDGSRRAWKSLAIAQHSAAVFDAWSTRQALNRGAHELNPMLKPFAGNSSIYAAAQVGPALLDLLSHKMLTSQHAVLRKTWWLPQVLGTAASVTAGFNNLHTH
jgi:hypothetical protein